MVATVTPAPPGSRLPDEGYRRRREALRAQYESLPAGAPVRLAKPTSNLFRLRESARGPGLDVSGFDGVLAVDPAARTADVQGMTTYERLVEATLPHGLMPLVVPELRTITLGGAVTGLGIESTSFRNGLPHESVVEMEILTGDGRIVVADREGEHADLFTGFPNSYGTLGYALRLVIELEPVRPFVRLRHVGFTDPAQYFAAVAEIAETRLWNGEAVDFLDGTVFAPEALYLSIGTMVDDAPGTSDYTGQDIYFRSIPRRSEDHLTIHDYLWRWDTDWFWCSRALGVQRPRVRRLLPKRWLRSDVYWKVIGFARRHAIRDRISRLRGGPGREAVIQDVEVPVGRAAEFLERFHAEIGMTPVWMCPLRLREGAGSDRQGPLLYPLDPGTTYVNFGFWGDVDRRPGQPEGERNRVVERLVAGLGGHKSLYSSSYYPEDEFRATYGGAAYDELKAAYDPGGRLLDLYEKCVKGR
jgi:FAD/FMN-containing dehydrogenase